MTDAEVKAIYLKIDSSGGLGEDDAQWWAEAIGTTRKAIEAKSFKEAVGILRRASWGDPEGCAKEIRGVGPCPHCKGEGVI
jgi:hypothetical protein